MNWHQQRFDVDVDIHESIAPLKWILKYQRAGSQDSNLEPYDQVVKVEEGWVDLEPVLLIICRVAKMSKYSNVKLNMNKHL